MSINLFRFLTLILSLSLFIFDQISKMYVIKNLDFFANGYQMFPFLNLVFVTNKGISFGLLSNFDISFYLGMISILISFAILVWIFKSQKKEEIIALSLILGGALGNGIDRIKDRFVIDFIDLHLFGYHWPSFNLADTFITIGAIILIFFNFRSYEFRKK